MTDLQRVELDLLKQFIRICDQLELKYYLICGTALGAVKYGGFIPWDDDVDVALPRSDYEVFIRKAQALLPENCFVQNYHTEARFPKIFTKLRRSDTTFIETSAEKLPINHGVFIDIFPLDGYPQDRKAQSRLERLKKWYKLCLSCAYSFDYNWKAKLAFAVLRFFGCHRRSARYAEKLDRLIASCSEKDSEIWCNHGNWQGKLDYAPGAWFGSGAQAVFEGIPVSVPSDCDDYLTRKYGDWRNDPPPDAQKGHHYVTVIDLDNSYLKYLG